METSIVNEITTMADLKEVKEQALPWHKILSSLDQQALTGDKLITLIDRKTGKSFEWPFDVANANEWKVLRE